MSIWISKIFGCQSSILHTSVDIHIDIQVEISKQGHFTMDVHIRISTNGYPCFCGYQSSISHALLISIWISIYFYGYPCRDLLYEFSIQGELMKIRRVKVRGVCVGINEREEKNRNGWK